MRNHPPNRGTWPQTIPRTAGNHPSNRGPSIPRAAVLGRKPSPEPRELSSASGAPRLGPNHPRNRGTTPRRVGTSRGSHSPGRDSPLPEPGRRFGPSLKRRGPSWGTPRSGPERLLNRVARGRAREGPTPAANGSEPRVFPGRRYRPTDGTPRLALPWRLRRPVVGPERSGRGKVPHRFPGPSWAILGPQARVERQAPRWIVGQATRRPSRAWRRGVIRRPPLPCPWPRPRPRPRRPPRPPAARPAGPRARRPAGAPR